MFFVFGPAGQMFRGSAEALGQVAAVRRAAALPGLSARHHNPFDGEGAGDVHMPQGGPPSGRAQTAMAAYAQTAQGPKTAREPLSLVRDVMTRGAVFVTPDMALQAAWRVLAERRFGQAPVINAQGRVVGLLLRADIAPLELLPDALAQQSAQALALRQVQEAMVAPVPTVQDDTHLRQLAGVLIDADLPGLPVTDEAGQLLGVVTRSDILRAVSTDPPLDLWSR